jgi:DNA-directed RNA polymerase subunit RPC12/RpoP
MDDIRYYPLIQMDASGTELQAMTPTNSESTVREHHRLWLTEIVPNYYRLGAKNSPSFGHVTAMNIHCPKCGAVLETISIISEEMTLPLYVCDECVSRFFAEGRSTSL